MHRSQCTRHRHLLRLNAVRKEGVALGLSPGSGSFSPAKMNGNAKRAASSVKKKSQPNGKGKGLKRGGVLNSDVR